MYTHSVLPSGRCAIRRFSSRALFGAVLVACALAGCQTAPPRVGLSQSQLAALEQAGFRQTDDGWALGLNDRVLFDSDKFELRSDAKATIERVGQSLLKVDLTHVRVYGYTDATGGDEYNDKLSKRRADAVGDTLAEVGMPREGITTFGEGKRNPVADNGTPEGRAQNRRVAIVIPTP
ncbi:OmpA family protein [Pararobbsia silviterrae]|uniref:OmpA-like domain-containing protein n=1 Tax=Pararobbsia silviterrae TaxID=1792498 RepID=A0A494XM52_9BURK|nr:OmpA family protein [Pararobbsia silviterrae]RKP51770.1 hypothetical protein D7S86_17570 [Pararobbsia silviterrae]